MKNCLHQFDLWLCLRDIALTDDLCGRVQSTVGSTIFRQIGSDCIKLLAKHEPVSKDYIALFSVPGLAVNSCSHFLWRQTMNWTCEQEVNLFFPKLLFVEVFYKSSRKTNQTTYVSIIVFQLKLKLTKRKPRKLWLMFLGRIKASNTWKQEVIFSFLDCFCSRKALQRLSAFCMRWEAHLLLLIYCFKY